MIGIVKRKMFEIVQAKPGFEEINTLAQDALAFFEMGKGKRRVFLK